MKNLIQKGMGLLLTLSMTLGGTFAVTASDKVYDSGASASTTKQKVSADVYFENGVIYTVDEKDTIAEALAIKDGKIIFVGSAEDGKSYRENAAEVVDLKEGMLLPGFTDAHAHTILMDFYDVDLMKEVGPQQTPEKVLKVLEDYIKANPDKESYYAFGFTPNMFEGEEADKGPRKERLDAICSDKPLRIHAYDGHSVWANSKSFEVYNVTPQTDPLPGGEIPLNEKGEVWGTVKENSVSLFPPQHPSTEVAYEPLRKFHASMNSFGYTSFLNISGNRVFTVPYDTYKTMEDNGDLTMRVAAAHSITSWDSAVDIVELERLRKEYQGDLFYINTGKVFLDGVFDNKNGYILEPYENTKDYYGTHQWEQDALNKTIAEINNNGAQIHIHAIGDAAAKMGLDAVEYAVNNTSEGDYRNTMTHLQLMSPEDIPRLGELNMVAAVQPFWHYKSPGQWDNIDLTFLGEERANRIYPMKSLQDSGAILAFGSDYPVTPEPNPFRAIEAAVTRNMPQEEGKSMKITDIDDPTYLLWPEERITIQEAIRGFTINSAYAIFAEDVTGSLEVGKDADVIVIDRNLLTINPLGISNTKVLRTYLQGKLVFDSTADASTEVASADTYFENGKIYTADANDSIVDALALKDGKIIFVGSNDEGSKYKETAKEVVDLEGKVMLPGFIDNHIHSDSPDSFEVFLDSIYEKEEIIKAIKDMIKANPDKESYTGFGLELNAFDGLEKVQGPRKELLDEICPDKPILIYASDGHTSWFNTKAQELLGITADTQAPKGGIIPKNEKGELWGTLQDSAMSLANSFPRDSERLLYGLKKYMTKLNSLGITSILSPSANGYMLVQIDEYKKLNDACDLSVRVRCAPDITEWNTENDLAKLKKYNEEINSDLLKVNGAKFFLDGVENNRTAFLLEPYSNNPSNYGQAGWEQEKLNQATASVMEIGLPVHFHAMGDAAVRMGLDAISYGLDTVKPEDSRNVMTHLQLVAPNDYKRFSEMGVIAVVNPFWHFDSSSQAHENLGERAKTMFPLNSFLKNNIRIASASDYPATSDQNPFIAIQVGITRNAYGNEGGGKDGKPTITDIDDPTYLLCAEERIDLIQMLRSYTIDGAYAIYSEDVTGSLEVNKSADMIIIDQDIFEINPLDIHKIQVLKTYLQGKEVYSKF